MSHELLNWLQRWYLAQCDGEWEEQHGVKIDSFDNPGWMVKIDLLGTALEGQVFPEIKTHRSERDWLMSWVEADKFNAACGPLNLVEALETFRAWAIEVGEGKS